MLLSLCVRAEYVSHIARQSRTDPKPHRITFNVEIKGSDRPARSIILAFPVPSEQLTQTAVKLTNGHVDSGTRMVINTVPGVCRYAVIRLDNIEPGQVVKASLVFEATLWKFEPDLSSRAGRVPRRLRPEVKRYVGPTANIESDNASIIECAQSILADAPKDPVARTRLLYDFVRSHVKYARVPFKGALAALESAQGDCEQRAALFVALCRASGIPARCVGVPGHTYAEFYVEPWGWLPAETAGRECFGSTKEHRVILHKGDGFAIKEMPEWDMTFFESRCRWIGGGPQVGIERKAEPIN